MVKNKEIADILERLEAEGAPESLLTAELSAIRQESELWEIADEVPALLPIMRAIYRRVVEIGGTEERGRAYLAMAHYLAGDFETSSALTTPFAAKSRDPVLLNLWALLPENAEDRLKRLRLTAERCPHPRIYRSLADVAQQLGAKKEAQEAIRWLIEHTQDVEELEKLIAAYETLR